MFIAITQVIFTKLAGCIALILQKDRDRWVKGIDTLFRSGQTDF
jgi:hypothetical protein